MYIFSKGLMSYNSVLSGLVLQTFLTGPTAWFVALVGAAITAVITATLMYFLGNFDFPILTLPFILFAWFVLLSSYKLDSIKLSDSLSPQSLANWELHIEGKINLLRATFNGIGQIFFVTEAIPGLLLFIAVIWASREMGSTTGRRIAMDLLQGWWRDV
ncbi:MULTISPECIES: urea transporter [unclassified Sporosarcina]|uniref:urea transporter n=1 Tax=unclassified Sporosarcina TaxID=2647733 RepID=UPI000C16A083|nr:MULTISPECIES: urea transporter [unclassified Sporosarcina]PID15023.1 hypothetical protein CSV63_09525 [Sporosarcina sp. P34]PID25208.1 hypothetical protein CSV60_06170 [Sporosarcina sp. P7]